MSRQTIFPVLLRARFALSPEPQNARLQFSLPALLFYLLLLTSLAQRGGRGGLWDIPRPDETKTVAFSNFFASRIHPTEAGNAKEIDRSRSAPGFVYIQPNSL
jgi:hypothetical protein